MRKQIVETMHTVKKIAKITGSSSISSTCWWKMSRKLVLHLIYTQLIEEVSSLKTISSKNEEASKKKYVT